MGQHLFSRLFKRPLGGSLSVGTRLLLVIGLLLFLVILFLNISAVWLVSNDKRAYIYESQAKEMSLIARDFVDGARRSIDFLRLALGTLDPTKQVSQRELDALHALVQNQTELQRVMIYRVDRQKKLVTVVSDSQTLADPAPSIETAEQWLREISQRGFGLVNESQVASGPRLGVVVGDKEQLSKNPNVIGIARGYRALKDFAQTVQGSNLSIVALSGALLFDSDPARLYTPGFSLSSDPLLGQAMGIKAGQGATEYRFEGRKYLGTWMKPGLDAVLLTRTDWDRAFSAVFYLTEKFILLGLIAIGFGIVLAILFAKTLTRPIVRLSKATKEIAQGNFDLKLEVHSQDEIGSLTESFNSMAIQISGLIDEKIEKVKLENELDIASTVQQTLIPPPSFKNEHILIHSCYQSASQCGGDWWGFFGIGKKMAVMIADATGHGFPSALITASARSCFSVMHKLASEDEGFSFSPSAMLSYANRVVFDASVGNIMMTFFIGVIDFETGQLTYSSAGHNPPWLFKHDDGKYKLTSLTALGMRLGEAREVPDFEEKSVPFQAGDVLFMYTDGVIEGKNLAGDMYGKKRMRKLVEAQLASGPEKVVATLLSDFMSYNTGKALDDDVTIAVAVMDPSAVKTRVKVS